MNRFVRYPLLATAASIAAFAFATSALATIMSPTYTTDPNAVSPTDGRPLGATATFIYDDACTSDCSLTIVLANTEDMTGISQGLTDFHFTSTSLTNLAQDGADGDQWADCDNAPKGSNFCTFSDAAFDQNSYGWTLGGSYVLAATPLTDAGIVKTPIDPNSDGVGNVQHNPWLVGPVDFFFTYDGSFSVGNVAFSFGTDASSPTVPGCTTQCCESNCGDQNVPEPAPLALLAAAAFAIVASRRHARN